MPNGEACILPLLFYVLAVEAVLSKRPIKMLGRTVDVEAYRPYLERDEPLKSVELTELPRALVEEIAELTVKDMKGKHYQASFTDSYN